MISYTVKKTEGLQSVYKKENIEVSSSGLPCWRLIKEFRANLLSFTRLLIIQDPQ